MSLALFALVAAIWGVLLIPLARHGRAELAAWAPGRDTPARLSRGARPWTTGDPPGEDPDPAAAAALALRARRGAARRGTAARRRRTLLVLAAATAAGLRAWAALGGRWWVAPAVAGGLLVAYLAILVGMGWRRSRVAARLAGREARPRPVRVAEDAWRGRVAARRRAARRRASSARAAPGCGPVAPTTE
ncbi:MAG TPA: hypothetical protein VFU54_08590 [Actinomycetota bacterium]|nr:hypothetical protein [Actinomycetota bacterium]